MVERLLHRDVTVVDEEDIGNVEFSEELLERLTAELTVALLDTRDQIALLFLEAALLSLLQNISSTYLR